MKKYLLILTLLLGSFSMAFAQENQSGGDAAKIERIKALYVAYVTDQLKFTSDEAQKFWPVHTQFENDLKAIKPNLSVLDKEQARLDIKKKYQDNFTRVIGANRCERFFKLSEGFNRKLMERIQNQRNNQQKPRPNMRRGQ